jgi:type IV pilus assembly protein PilB
MASARVRLGELLVDAQIITREQLAEVLALQREDGRRLGTLLVESGLVTETQVTQILSQQLSVPWVSLYHIDFSRQLLDLVPHELAEKYCLVPIFVRRVRGLGETLYVAMDDPSDEAAQREISQASRLPVRSMIAPPTDIRAAIRVYYGGGNDSPSLSQALMELADTGTRQPVAPPEPARVQPAAPPVTGAPADAGPREPDPPKASASQPEPERESAPPDSGPQIEAREITIPAKRAAAQRLVTLTLLDGTQVKVPARQRGDAAAAAESEPERTAELKELLTQLRSAAHAARAQQAPGDAASDWQSLFTALLSLLLKKRLIDAKEFMRELKKL